MLYTLLKNNTLQVYFIDICVHVHYDTISQPSLNSSCISSKYMHKQIHVRMHIFRYICTNTDCHKERFAVLREFFDFVESQLYMVVDICIDEYRYSLYGYQNE